jgi:hypothetical protein
LMLRNAPTAVPAQRIALTAQSARHNKISGFT